MNRKEVAQLIARYTEHERYGELTQDDRIMLWLMQRVFALTDGQVEEEKEREETSTYFKEVPFHAAEFVDAVEAMPDVPPDVQPERNPFVVQPRAARWNWRELPRFAVRQQAQENNE